MHLKLMNQNAHPLHACRLKTSGCHHPAQYFILEWSRAQRIGTRDTPDVNLPAARQPPLLHQDNAAFSTAPISEINHPYPQLDNPAAGCRKRHRAASELMFLSNAASSALHFELL
jgi:hypothetical protein